MQENSRIVLTVTMVPSLATTAFAAETVSNNTNHDYKAYPIFAGTQGEGAALGNVVWGSGIDASKTTGADGKIQVIGLDHGTYKLLEIKAPAGYNLLTELTDIVINATHQEKSATSAETVYSEDSVTNVNVENQTGSTLPETGGMGTTMFYLFGGMMVLAAVVLLVAKKRMSNIE